MTSPALDWGVAAAAMPSQDVSGDLCVVKCHGSGWIVGAIDGLGHGEEAAFASRLAAAILVEHPGNPPDELIERCHLALRGTRGVVMNVGAFDPQLHRLTWAGVGNVQGVLLRGSRRLGDEDLMVTAGVVGIQLPRLRPAPLQVLPGDTLVFATDGIASEFGREAARHLPPQVAADAVLARHRKYTDDALVVVARFPGDVR